MRQYLRLFVPCLGSLLASCASISPGEPPEAAPAESVAARAEPVAAPAESVAADSSTCDDLFIPVTDKDQDKDEDPCPAPKSEGLEGLEKGDVCKLPVDVVHPAQPAVGMTAVNCKRDKLVAKSEKKLDKYLRKGKRVVPAVIGPDGNYYITDHHHLATGVYKTLQQKPEYRPKIRLYAQIVGDFYDGSNSSPSQSEMRHFWKVQMQACNNAYLKYQGQPVDPLNSAEMPTSLSAMKDDPYRTLSRWVRDADGYVKPEVHPANFLEFTWAAKFRRDIPESTSHCAITDGVESAPCQEQIRQLRSRLRRAMASARAYDSVEWIEAGHCAKDLKGNPEALVACGYNPALVDVDVDKYITVDRGCESSGLYRWQEVTDGELPGDALAWYLYAHGHVTQPYWVCRVAKDDAFYAGVYDPGDAPGSSHCSYYDADDKKAKSSTFDALTGVQAMVLWSEYTEEDAENDADDFFEDAVPLGAEGTSGGETYLCASGKRIGWVKKGKKTCHLSKKDGLRVPFSVLVEN